jgi:hypothetical protein
MDSKLSTPMKSIHGSMEGKRGGEHPGHKESVPAGGPSGSGAVNTPFRDVFGPPPKSPADGPSGVTMQVTEDVGAMNLGGHFPTGTSTRMP